MRTARLAAASISGLLLAQAVLANGPRVVSVVNSDLAPAPAAALCEGDASGRLWSHRERLDSRTSPSEWCFQTCRRGPGPAAYGAPGELRHAVVFVQILHTPVAVNPWERIQGRGALARLEEGRQRWLREQGWVGGVRTHVNEDARRRAQQPAPVEIEPTRHPKRPAPAAPVITEEPLAAVVVAPNTMSIGERVAQMDDEITRPAAPAARASR